MVTGFEDFQKLSKDQADVARQSAEAVNKALQALASETADYSKKSLDAGSAALEKLLSARSFDGAVKVQGEYMRSACEGYMTQIGRIGAIVADMAKDAYGPYETLFAKYGK